MSTWHSFFQINWFAFLVRHKSKMFPDWWCNICFSTEIHGWTLELAELRLTLYSNRNVILGNIMIICVLECVTLQTITSGMDNSIDCHSSHSQKKIHSPPRSSLLTEGEVSKILLSAHLTTCPLGPIPSHILQDISLAIVLALAHIINTSLHTSTLSTSFNQVRVTLLLKQTSLNTSMVENLLVWMVSLVPFTTKKLERVEFDQSSTFLEQNKLVNSN